MATRLIDLEELRTWILFEDNDLLVVNKPGDVVCHPSKNGPWSSLVGACREYTGLETLHMPSRLDRETSGVVVLVKNHTVLPHLAVAQSTSAMNWGDVELRVFSSGAGASEGRFIAPGGSLQMIRVDGGRLVSDPSGGRVKWRVTR